MYKYKGGVLRLFLWGNASEDKKIFNLFASSKKSSTFASRLLSKVYKRLILSALMVLCPGTVKCGS